MRQENVRFLILILSILVAASSAYAQNSDSGGTKPVIQLDPAAVARTREAMNQQPTLKKMPLTVLNKNGKVTEGSTSYDPNSLSQIIQSANEQSENSKALDPSDMRGQSSVTNYEAALVPVTSGKDAEKKRIEFTMADPKDPNKYVQAEFYFDPSEINSIAQKRQEMIARKEDTARRMAFMRKYLSLSPDYPEEKIIPHLFLLSKKEIIDLETQYEKSSETQSAIAGDGNAFREFLRNYFNLPDEIGMNGKAAESMFSQQPKEAREEIMRLYHLKTQSVGKIAKESFKTVFSSSQHGFLSQTVLFGVAQGAIMFMECQKQMSYNPLCRQQMIDGFKDPIGQIAFGSFIMANRFTSDMLGRKFNDVSTPTAKFLRSAMPYIGMSAGMLASNISSEVLNLMVTCAKTLISPKPADPMLAMVGGGQQQDPCDAAQKEFFNFNNKVEQYIPMLISMAGATLTLTETTKGIQAAKVVMGKVAQNGTVTRITATKFMQGVSKASQPTLRVIGLTLAFRISPAGWVLNAMTVKAIIMQIAQNIGFLELDHSFMPFLNKGWAQFWRARLVKSSDENIKDVLLLNQQSGFSSSINYQLLLKAKKTRSQDPTGNLATAIKGFSNQMEAWRQINHSKIFIGLQSWGQITIQLIRELNLTELFYNYYVSKIFDNFKYIEKAKTPEGLDGDEADKSYDVAFRKYPLFGVAPTGVNSCEGAVTSTCVTDADLYMKFPKDMVEYQKNTIRYTIAIFREVIKETPSDKLSEVSKKPILKLFEELSVDNEEALGKALEKLNKYVGTRELNDEAARELLAFFRTRLGNPIPSWNEGGLMPTFFNEQFKDKKLFEDLTFKRGIYLPTHYTEHLLFNMLCGPDSETQPDKVIEISDGFAPEFHPPRIVLEKNLKVKLPDSVHQSAAETTSLCNPVANGLKFSDLYRSLIVDSKNPKGLPINKYIAYNLNPKVLGDWTNTNRNSTSNFLDWWNSSTKKAMVNAFTHLDSHFQGLLIEMTESLNNEAFSGSASLLDWVTTKVFGFKTELDAAGDFKIGYAKRALSKSHIQEMNVYLTVLGELENLQSSDTYQAKKVKLDPNQTLLQQMNMPLYARTESQNDLMKHLKYTTSAIEGMKVVNGKAQLPAPVTYSSFNAEHDAMVKSFVDYKKYLDTVKFSKVQKEAATAAVEALEHQAMAMSVYVFNTQLTNFSMTQDYQTYLQNDKRIKEANKVKNKVKQHNSTHGG